MVAAHPLLGVGPDNFRLRYGSYAGLTHTDTRTHSNNMYLEVLSGGGLLMAGAFAWLIWRAADMFSGIGNAGPVQSAVAAAGAAIAVHGLVDSFLSFAPTYILFAMTLGYAAVFARGVERSDHAHRV
jgi:O-antigen ligase